MLCNIEGEHTLLADLEEKMHLKQLEIDNFKSFANKVEIPLLPGFTTISGPNGSGKSNIIDSILFALGLTSARALRSEHGVSDLITTHNNRGEASVKVIFVVNEETGEELSVLRRIKKSTQGYTSSYYMNDKPATLSQIHLELEKYNVTPNGYNVIMQGDVVTITTCSPVERRKIIDEIAGVADFDRKLELAQGELETVDLRVNEANIILDEVDARMEALSAEREVALKYDKLRKEKTELESQINVVKYFDTKRSLDMVHQNILDAQKEKKEAETSVEKTKKILSIKQEEYEKLSDEVKEKGEDKQLEVKKQAEEKKGEIERKTMAIDHSDKVILDNKKTITNAKSGIENCEDIIQKTQQSIEEKNLKIKELEVLLNNQKDELNTVLNEMSGLGKTANEHIEHLRALKGTLDKLKDEENNIIKEKLPLEGKYNNLQNELNDVNETLDKYNKDNASFSDDKDKLELQISTLKKELDDCKILQQYAFEELDKIKNKVNDTAYNIRLANTKIAQMEAKKQAFKEFGLGGGVDTIMRSSLKGVHGALAQLIEVESEYTDAIMAALGNRARFVIVEDENVATRAIDILKSSGKDRATFLPLNKMKPAPSRLSLPKDKGVIDFAINLLDFDDKYLNSLYFALGETLVVEDMQVAKKMMGKYRIVTLEGEIFEKSGAITGGAKRQANIAFGKGEDKELEKYRARLKEFEDELDALDKKQKQVNLRLEEIREKYSSANNEYNSAKFELQNLEKNHSSIEENITKKTDRRNEIKKELSELEKKLDKYEEKHMNKSEEILKLQEEIAQTESLIDESELDKLKEKTKVFEDNIKETNSKITNTQTEIDKENNNIKFQNTIIEQREKDILKLTDDNKSLENDKIRFKGEIEILSKDLEVLNAEIEELGKNLIELQTKRDKMRDDLLEDSKNINIMENNIGLIQEKLESYKARRRELEPLHEIAREDLISAGVEIEKLEPVEISVEEITNKIARLQKKMDDLGDVNMKALKDYDEVYARQNELRDKIKTLIDEKAAISERMKGYEALKKETFLKTYRGIKENFKEVFQELSDGEGDLVLENEDSPFEGGLTFIATIADKKKQKLAGLSGGEKSLTALAFVFAIQRHIPAPFYAFDEVDMHLDAANDERLANMINKSSKNTQFVVISLRKPMIDSADRMIGVTQRKGGITKISGVKLKDDQC